MDCPACRWSAQIREPSQALLWKSRIRVEHARMRAYRRACAHAPLPDAPRPVCRPLIWLWCTKCMTVSPPFICEGRACVELLGSLSCPRPALPSRNPSHSLPTQPACHESRDTDQRGRHAAFPRAPRSAQARDHGARDSHPAQRRDARGSALDEAEHLGSRVPRRIPASRAIRADACDRSPS